MTHFAMAGGLLGMVGRLHKMFALRPSGLD
jgi:hypothetical protein